MRVGIAGDHGGFTLKEQLVVALREHGHEVVDLGAASFDPVDDFPEYVLPLASAVAAGEVSRGLAVCGSGVGACVAANKIKGVRAALVTESGGERHRRRLAKIAVVESGGPPDA